jgi:DNA-binding NarL/FixJ family response regulator
MTGRRALLHASTYCAKALPGATDTALKGWLPPGPCDVPIRVVLADSQAIFRVGTANILAAESEIEVVAEAETWEETLAAVSRGGAGVLLFEPGVSAKPTDAIAELLSCAPELRLVVVADDAGEHETLDYLRRGARGLVNRAIEAERLVDCLRQVAAGGVWLDQRGLNWLLAAFRAQAEQLDPIPVRNSFSQKELSIIAGVTRGLRNQDIAREVGTSEQVIKNCLRKIYDKLGVEDRLELALCAIQENLLESGPVPELPELKGPPQPDAGWFALR